MGIQSPSPFTFDVPFQAHLQPLSVLGSRLLELFTLLQGCGFVNPLPCFLPVPSCAWKASKNGDSGRNQFLSTFHLAPPANVQPELQFSSISIGGAMKGTHRSSSIPALEPPRPHPREEKQSQCSESR